MILVTGASGNVGKELVPQLLERGSSVRVLTRDARRVARWRGSVECAVGDLGDPASLHGVFDGVEAMFLVTMHNGTRHDEIALSRARSSGVRHVVKLSTLEADDTSLRVGRWHAAKEQVVRASGLTWTILRPGMFMSTALQWADSVRTHATAYFPGGRGRVAPIDPRDVAAAAAVALTDRAHEGRTYGLTGAQLLRIADMVDILARVLGRPLSYVDVPVLAAKLFLCRQFGLQTGLALAELASALKKGKGARVADTLEELTGRPPRSFEAWCRDHADAFTAPGHEPTARQGRGCGVG